MGIHAGRAGAEGLEHGLERHRLANAAAAVVTAANNLAVPAGLLFTFHRETVRNLAFHTCCVSLVLASQRGQKGVTNWLTGRSAAQQAGGGLLAAPHHPPTRSSSACLVHTAAQKSQTMPSILP